MPPTITRRRHVGWRYHYAGLPVTELYPRARRAMLLPEEERAICATLLVFVIIRFTLPYEGK